MSYSPVHKASLVPAATHPQALLELVDQKLSRPIIEYLIDSVVETVDFALGRPSHSGRGRALSRRSEGSAFATMVNNVVTRAEVEIPVILATLVYLNRAKPHLHIALEEWANERVFLGALIVASKYLNDSSLKNVHWAVCTGVFGKRDIGRIEREFLDVLDFELSISEDDLMAHHDSVMSLVQPTHRHSHGISSPPLPHLAHSGSPSSTEASFSPRTPTDERPMAVDPHPKAERHHHRSRQVDHAVYPVPPVPAHVSQPRHEKRQSHSSSTFRILRSLPFPRPFSHLTSSSSSSSSASSSSESQAPQQSTAQQQGRCQLLPPFAAQPSAQVYA
ncbi:hypothetical protein EDB92DRAFT_1788253 [Lactarius akahatsu]|uniref:Cyclin N-terminal domain-containing protein n=1 Tax=Lactarius akahatsu TaxID=416441 RepID=A0AAD4LT40_9AGAM|nr:hypothetical protein EDB92DRAFT_1788253 [Lactarius akahatsu]